MATKDPLLPVKFRIVKPGMGCERFTALRNVEGMPAKGITWAKWSTGFATLTDGLLIVTPDVDVNELLAVLAAFNDKATADTYTNTETGETIGHTITVPARKPRTTNKKGA